MSKSSTAFPPANILVVDDTPNNLRFLSNTLKQQGYKVRGVVDGKMALIVAKTALPDVILLDIKMPNMDGYEVCEHLKAAPETREIPVIFLSALSEAADKVKAFAVGGVDYIGKPFQVEEVLARVKNQLNLLAARSQIIRLNEELELRVKERTSQLEESNRKLKQEVMERQHAQQKLLFMAWHDHLTGLANRALFMTKLNQSLDRVKRESNYQFAMLFLDFNRFRVINNSLGHLMGDELLVAIAKRLQPCVEPPHLLARLGGDEFTILLEEIDGLDGAIALAERIQKQLDISFKIAGQYEVFINASIGIVLANDTYEKPEQILRDADTAMYWAKDSDRRTCYQIFDQTMHAKALTRLQVETDLRLAIENQGLMLYYQPIVSLKTGELAGFEALVRWRHPTRGVISPGHFIPVAEETGLIVPMGLWVLREACRQLREWQRQRLGSHTALTLSVNLSVKQFSQPQLVETVDRILAETEIDGSHLKLEITESAIVDNAEIAIAILEQLKARQVQLSIDDFGTGYSSLSYLQQFPVDTLKIDRAFVSRIGRTDEDLKIIQAIVTLAHSLGMRVIAEGIETPQQLAYLKELGCEFGQGYFFARPLDMESAQELMATQPCWYGTRQNRQKG